MNTCARCILLAWAFLLCPALAFTQWLHHPTAGVPRRSDGSVDLTATTPRMPDGHPDLSGMWGWQPPFGPLTKDLKPDEIQPWAAALAAQRMNDMAKDDPSNYGCLPQGPRMTLQAPIPAKIVQTPGLLLILSEDLTYRQIFLDGRALPKDPDPSFMGYSIGRWDGEALVVETIGFKDRTWLDFGGTPHSEALRIIERIRRPSFGHLVIEETIEDPRVFARPFTVTITAQFIADTELLEYICAENERSRQHFTGTISELINDARSRAVEVAPEILAKYAGTYDIRFPEAPSTPHFVTIRLVDGGLVADGAPPAIPFSETHFLGLAGEFDVVRDEHGFATHLLIRVAEGEIKATRVSEPK